MCSSLAWLELSIYPLMYSYIPCYDFVPSEILNHPSLKSHNKNRHPFISPKSILHLWINSVSISIEQRRFFKNSKSNDADTRMLAHILRYCNCRKASNVGYPPSHLITEMGYQMDDWGPPRAKENSHQLVLTTVSTVKRTLCTPLLSTAFSMCLIS